MPSARRRLAKPLPIPTRCVAATVMSFIIRYTTPKLVRGPAACVSHMTERDGLYKKSANRSLIVNRQNCIRKQASHAQALHFLRAASAFSWNGVGHDDFFYRRS